jgi:hypothetical protein
MDDPELTEVLAPYLDVVDAISKHFVALSAANVGLYAEDRVEALLAVSTTLQSLPDQETFKRAEIPSEFTDGDKKKGTRMISLKEAATQAGVPLETLRTRIKRARKRDQWQPFVASGEVGRGQLFANEEELRRWLGKPQN